MPLPTLSEILEGNPLYLEGAVGTEEASRITGVPAATLETKRTRGGGPAFIKRGKTVMYRRRTLLEWMDGLGERAAEARLTLHAVRRHLLRLPEEQTAVVMLVCVEGLSYKEVSEALEISIGTVASRLARARETLKAMIEGMPA